LLVDTLLDLKLTREMLEAMRRAEPKATTSIGNWSIRIPTAITPSAINWSPTRSDPASAIRRSHRRHFLHASGGRYLAAI
jgi:hypothetical protein